MLSGDSAQRRTSRRVMWEDVRVTGLSVGGAKFAGVKQIVKWRQISRPVDRTSLRSGAC